MIGAFAEAGRILEEPSFVRIATEAADFVLAEMVSADDEAEADPDAAESAAGTPEVDS
jgi:uncharacterized protein YyaL (SSP411 family)